MLSRPSSHDISLQPDDEESTDSVTQDLESQIPPQHIAQSSHDTIDCDQSKSNPDDDGKIWMSFAPNDPEDPYNWSILRKWITVAATSYAAFSTTGIGAGYAMGNQALAHEVHVSEEVSQLAFAIFNLGFGLGPLLLAPLSESYGRMPVYISTLLIYAILIIPLAVGNHIAVMIVLRFFVGFFGSTGSSMTGGTIADMFRVEDRGWPMLFFSLNAIGATGIWPIAMAFAVQNRGYRFMAWMQFMQAAISPILVVLFARESRGTILLSRRAAKLRKKTGDQRYGCKADEERKSFATLLSISLLRPVRMLLTELPVILFSIWGAFAWGMMYVDLESVPLVFQTDYNFSLGSVGLVFVSINVASAFAVSLFFLQTRLQSRMLHKGPEARLYIAMIGGVFLPAGLYIFGFAQGRGHWFGPVSGLCVMFVGIISIYCAVFLYMADFYGAFASSAMAAQSLLRNIFATFLPLFTTQMFNEMYSPNKVWSFTYASLLAAVVATILGFVPVLLYKYGSYFREKSAYKE